MAFSQEAHTYSQHADIFTEQILVITIYTYLFTKTMAR
jgi:hypothetical protein